MIKLLFYSLLMTTKRILLILFKCFSAASTMRPLQIKADPLEIYYAELNKEIEEEVGDIIALPFPSPDGSTGR